MAALAFRERMLGEPQPPAASAWFRFGLWLAVFVVVAGSLLPWGIQGPDQGLIRSHWRSAQWLWQEAAGRFAFSPRFLLSAGATLLADGVGAWLLMREGRGREGWVAALLVVVPALVHWVHQPFWKFYLLHFASGVAVLAGWGMDVVCLRVWRGLSTPASRAKPGCFLRSLMVAAALLAGWLNWDFARAVEDARRIEGNPRRSESPLMEALQEVAPKARYGYTRAPAFLAQAICLALPELTILPRKRFWSGDITENRIREIIRERQPEILLLREEGESGRTCLAGNPHGLLHTHAHRPGADVVFAPTARGKPKPQPVGAPARAGAAHGTVKLTPGCASPPVVTPSCAGKPGMA